MFRRPPIDVPDSGTPLGPMFRNTEISLTETSQRAVRHYGDEVAAVVAEDYVAADRAIRALKVEYEEYPYRDRSIEAAKRERRYSSELRTITSWRNSDIRIGTTKKRSKEPGLIKVEGWYYTPTVQHAHIENHICYAYQEQGGRMTVVHVYADPHTS